MHMKEHGNYQLNGDALLLPSLPAPQVWVLRPPLQVEEALFHLPANIRPSSASTVVSFGYLKNGYRIFKNKLK